ncbi:hypothetical protein M5K25_017655 [Dendrobium thyrsiflorum]|uniref:Uncharacterized protein n=1 Tax=Dendrobium thyrsiflorum TaxID=117978 RepID=A0ABD0UNB0_DENTH
MTDPERDFDMAYDEQGYIHILHSTFFDVDPLVDHTVEGYMERILDTLVNAIEEQLGNVQWRIASDPHIDMKSDAYSCTFPSRLLVKDFVDDSYTFGSCDE